MSVKTSAIAAAVAASMGFTVGGDGPVVESMLNNSTVSDAQIVAFDKTGRCVMFVSVAVSGGAASVRPVCDSMGNVKLFGNAASAVASLKRGAPAAVATYTPFVAASSVGNPVQALIAKHKAAKIEAAKAADSLNKPQTGLVSLASAAQALGWDNATAGTAEANEWADLTARTASVTQWKTVVDADLAALTASLTAAGIDPTTYLPI